MTLDVGLGFRLGLQGFREVVQMTGGILELYRLDAQRVLRGSVLLTGF